MTVPDAEVRLLATLIARSKPYPPSAAYEEWLRKAVRRLFDECEQVGVEPFDEDEQ